MPASPEDWLVEIAAAYQHAHETRLFGRAVGKSLGESDLFHVTPLVVLKFRGIRRSEGKLARAAEAALASYLATDDDSRLVKNPNLAFAFSYLVSHHGLGMLSQTEAEELIEYVERHRKKLERLIKESTKPNTPRQPTVSARLRRLLGVWRGARRA